MKIPAILTPEPGLATLKPRPWAGSRLARIRGGGNLSTPKIGESWEFSTLKGSESRVCGKPLSEILQRDLPFLAKLIDTAAPLSVQIHPDDDPQSGICGKEEAWVILDADENAQVWVGLAHDCSSEGFKAALEQVSLDPKQSQPFLSCLNAIPVHKGDIVLVPAGVVHAIGAGIFLAEIQQPSDKTFRFFDYGSKRPLHVESALSHLKKGANAVLLKAHDRAPHRLKQTSIAGKHLRLTAFSPGDHAISTDSNDNLVISVLGTCEAFVAKHKSELVAGDLRLCTQSPWRLRVAQDSLAVVAWISPPT